ncbi:MAG: cellulase family glycosylhydrolase [Balneolaceae bacterium]|nr:cellulase family glycosylhydrolase [Balneolaceae bacterium]
MRVRSPEGLKSRMDQFLRIADSHGMKIMFVLFDDVWGDDPNLGEQPAPIPGVHNSGWVESPGHDQRLDKALYPVLKAYVQDLISHFDGDDRVLMWDLYNEPGNGKNTPSSTLPLLKNVTQWARQVDPSQPITIGMWNTVG